MTRLLLLTAFIAFAIANCCHGQEYKDALTKTFLAFDTTQNMQQKIDQSNRLGLIAKKWGSEWAPHYYNAYAKAQLSYMEQDASKKDAYVDEAEKELGEAVSILGKDNDETYVLAAMIANARMAVDGKSRWQKYGKIFNDNLDKAKEVNPENPRIYFLLGTSKYFTPKMFGGGKKAALPYFEKANGLYAKESNDNIDKPYWGKMPTEYFLAESKKDD